MADLARDLQGREGTLSGQIRIGAPDGCANFVLPKVCADISRANPDLDIQIVSMPRVVNLTKREADIAIRHGRPEQPDLIARLLGETSAALYAAPAYLDRVGRPKTREDLSQCDFVGFERSPRLLDVMHELGLDLTTENFRVTSESGPTYMALIQRGFGLGFVTRDMLKFYPELEPVFPSLPRVPVPVWLVTHRELHTSRKIRLVFDSLAEGLTEALAQSG